jgi:hypothetical protein
MNESTPQARLWNFSPGLYLRCRARGCSCLMQCASPKLPNRIATRKPAGVAPESWNTLPMCCLPAIAHSQIKDRGVAMAFHHVAVITLEGWDSN